jgi:REP element-mobilizing transposase RayT
MEHSYLRRLAPEAYRGEAFVHWSMTVEERATGWLTAAFHGACREILVHTVFKHRLACPVYCLMPDHVHLLWLGYAPESDQLAAAAFFRKHVNRLLAPRSFQLQGYDHVLRAEERERGVFQKAAGYILENPIRKGIAEKVEAYAYSGCVIPGYPELTIHQADFWERFWRAYYFLMARAKGEK